jgi:HSP20 family protein
MDGGACGSLALQGQGEFVYSGGANQRHQKEVISMTEPQRALQSARESKELRLVRPEKLVDQMQRTFDAIARRAFEIFEHDGRPFGHDLENWFKAESEMLHPVHVDLAEADDALTIQAETPGFTEKELEVSVEPRRLTIAGKRETTEETKGRKTIYKERCSDEILRVVELPVEVDPEKVKASLKNGLLQVELQKAASSKKVPVKVQAA